jgi:2-polyprenyl-3-methyl-5-hydroxy-6-metoxy-1,4-benzoquinol methylase
MSYTLLIPSHRSSDGAGHVHRMIRLLQQISGSRLYVPQDQREEFLSRFPAMDASRVVSQIINPDLIVLDAPWLEAQRMRQLLRRAPVVAIDPGGAARSMASYVIDTLPYPGDRMHEEYFARAMAASAEQKPAAGGTGLAEALKIPGGKGSRFQAPNVFDPGYLPLPERGPEPGDEVQRILVSFGASDPAGLTDRFIQVLSASPLLASLGGTVIRPLYSPEGSLPRLPRGWEMVPYDPNIMERYREYDLVICAYGLTAWEAQYAGTRTLLVDASFYHGELARISGFLSVPANALENVAEEILNSDFLERLAGQCRRVRSLKAKSLSELIPGLRRYSDHCCPACGEFDDHRLLSRDPRRSFFRCGRCGTIFQIRVVPLQIEYDQDYFFEQYKNQYGKTYLQDFDHIKSMGMRRLESIGQNLHAAAGKPRLLDIGCAFGPFLSAASESGFAAEGTDISREAVEYVSGELGFPARAGDIADEAFRREFEPSSYDVVTMWYVIEHFPDLTKILPWIRSILKPGGVFALATPNSRGISGRRSLPGFLRNGPEDHFTVWDPAQAERVGRIHGFHLAEWESTGHHGERFPGPLGKPALRGFSNFLSRAWSLGDTFEAFYIRLPDEEFRG